MINQIILVGRVVEKPVLRNYESDNVVATLTLAVQRPFKSIDGNYETDFIKVTLWKGIAQNTCEYTQKGDTVGIKGRLSVRENEISFAGEKEIYKKKIQQLEVIGERVVFIHSNKKTEQVETE